MAAWYAWWYHVKPKMAGSALQWRRRDCGQVGRALPADPPAPMAVLRRVKDGGQCPPYGVA